MFIPIQVIKKEKGPAPPPPSAASNTQPQTPIAVDSADAAIIDVSTKDQPSALHVSSKVPAEPKPIKDPAPGPPIKLASSAEIKSSKSLVDEQKSSKEEIAQSSSSTSGEIIVEFKQQPHPTSPPKDASTSIVVSSTQPPGTPIRSSSIDEISSPHQTTIKKIGGISITSTPTSKLNTSMITINSDTPDPSNSLASNVSQVTVVTSHPPVLIDNSVTITDTSNDVVIVSNEMNKTRHMNESSTDEEFPSLDSLEFTPKHKARLGQSTIVIGGGDATPSQQKWHQQNPRARKLDESEVFIVNVEDDSIQFDTSSSSNNKTLDTSHVSVVTVGEEIHVKDSSNVKAPTQVGASDPKNVVLAKNKLNGQIKSSGDDVSIIVNKKKANPEKRISPDSSVGSMDSRTHSECGSTRSSSAGGVTPSAAVATNKIDRSDAESIATTASHDSRGEPDEEVVIRRPKPAVVPAAGRSKEEIELRNLRKKTRKRTRKFEIDGVQMTTTTSQVIYGDDENGKLYDDHIIRKQELRELKMLQKQEKKQFLDLQTKEQLAREQQEKRFEQERITLERTYESDMDTLARQHKQLVDKTETQQESDLRATSKKIRAEQERELRLVSFLSVYWNEKDFFLLQLSVFL